MSSAARPGWDRALIEFHSDTHGEGELRLPVHTVVLTTRPGRRISARFDGGRVREDRGATGDLFVVPAGRSHWCAWEGPADFLVAYLAPASLARAVRDDGLAVDRLEIGYRFRAHDRGLAALLFAMHAQLARAGAEDPLYVDTLAVQLGVHLLFCYGSMTLCVRSHRHGLSRAKLKLVLDYLNAYLDRSIELAELADLVDLSPFHFLRLFRASSGLAPHQYLVQRRVETAKAIMARENVPLAEVAYRVGFADQSHLTHHFRRIVGVPPGRFRRALRGGCPPVYRANYA